MPDLIGSNLQDVQDAIQQLSNGAIFEGVLPGVQPVFMTTGLPLISWGRAEPWTGNCTGSVRP